MWRLVKIVVRIGRLTRRKQKITLAKVDDSVQFRGELTKLNINTYINPAFTMTGKIAAFGSITSLKDGNGGNPDTVASRFGGMFMNCESTSGITINTSRK